ncbi:unnamed protein product [Protopolystoma xenopodis]|uniref:Uncharacterized protein n=1 Tax=Protopolystoma xenopodis TaxID=117903 RepID=A0A448X5Z5_9PLAT|nr:unnamed protein product [Protopolystoma xenopodis]
MGYRLNDLSPVHLPEYYESGQPYGPDRHASVWSEKQGKRMTQRLRITGNPRVSLRLWDHKVANLSDLLSVLFLVACCQIAYRRPYLLKQAKKATEGSESKQFNESFLRTFGIPTLSQALTTVVPSAGRSKGSEQMNEDDGSRDNSVWTGFQKIPTLIQSRQGDNDHDEIVEGAGELTLLEKMRLRIAKLKMEAKEEMSTNAERV